MILGGTLASCGLLGSQRKGPIAEESSRLKTNGEELIARGQKLMDEGIRLQNDAKEKRVLSEEKLKQVGALESQNNPSAASVLWLEAKSEQSDAMASESRGRQLEEEGREMLRRGNEAVQRGRNLDEKSKQIERKER